MEIQNLIAFIDVFAAVTFAATGALVASRKGLDILGFMWLGVMTGVGGGTVRDLVLDAPVFWVVNPNYLTICLVTAIAVYLAAPRIESRYTLLLWFDALGLAFVTVAGGIIRDLIGNEPSIVLKREIYVTAAATGAGIYVLTDALDVDWLNPALAGFIVTFTIRALAIAFNWSMPGYQRPARDAGSTQKTNQGP